LDALTGNKYRRSVKTTYAHRNIHRDFWVNFRIFVISLAMPADNNCFTPYCGNANLLRRTEKFDV